MISRAFLTMLFACCPLLSFAGNGDVWQGLWNEGERGARTYNKIRITPNTLLFSRGGNWDYFYFPSKTSKVWCQVKYEVLSRVQGDTYPDQDPSSQVIARRLNRTFETVLLKLENSKCTGYTYLQMAFLSDLGDRYVDVAMYDDKRSKIASFNFHRVIEGGR